MSVQLDRLVTAQAHVPPTVEVSELRPHEIPSTFCEEALPLVAEGFSDRPWDPEAVAQRVLNPRALRRLLTARMGVALVGLTTVHSTPRPGVAQLHWLAVAASHRRAGLGAALVVAAGRAAAADGYTEMVLKTETYRAGAIALYTRLGFTVQAG